MLAPTPASPEAAGMSGKAFDRIEDHLKRRYIDTGRFPGTQLVVFRRGNVVHSAVQGFADLERKAPLKDDTIFRIYSMTKPITSVAFMMLLEEGRVALDEPVHKYIPEWKNLGVFQAGIAPAFLTKPPARPMQIVDLLRHTSGLTYGFQSRSNVDAAYRAGKIGEVEKSGTLRSMIEDLAKIPLEFSPGDAWNYSVSTDVVGYLIEKISGKPFEQFLKERIFDPLGMDDTDFFVPAEKAHRFAACYNADPGGLMSFQAAEKKGGLELQDDPTTSSFLERPSFISGGGGLMFDRGGLPDLLPRAAQRRRTRRGQAYRPEDVEVDDLKPSAGRARFAGDVAIDVRRGDLQWHRLRTWLRGHDGSGANAASRQPRRI